jgi:AcrR family transcriptional regulator
MGQRTYGGMTGEQRAADRRARLVAAGLETFGREGYACATIEGLCRAAGVTARHFYEHFPAREDLLLAVYEQVLETHRLEMAAGLVDEGDLEERVRAITAAAVRAWTANPQAARVAFVEIVGVSARVEQRRLEAVAEYTGLITAIADDLHRRGLVGRPGRPLAARALVGAMIALVELWLTAPEPPAINDMIEEGTRVALAIVR